VAEPVDAAAGDVQEEARAALRPRVAVEEARVAVEDIERFGEAAMEMAGRATGVGGHLPAVEAKVAAGGRARRDESRHRAGFHRERAHLGLGDARRADLAELAFVRHGCLRSGFATSMARP